MCEGPYFTEEREIEELTLSGDKSKGKLGTAW